MTDEQIWQRLTQVVAGVQRKGLSPAVAALEPLVAQARDPRLRGELARLLGFYWLRQGRHEQAFHFSAVAVSCLPASHDAAYNAVYALMHLNRLDEAIARARQALQVLGESHVWHNILSTMLGNRGRLDEARLHGSRALQLKDALTAAQPPAVDLTRCPVPPFDARQPARQVISFSLYGQQAKYLQGAVWNAEAAPYLYPGWTCRFHIDDSVPEPTVQALLARGAQVQRMAGHWPAAGWGTLWRFAVADDPSVDRYLLRDADSLLNLREAVAVQAWVDSDRHFHVMRDHHDHSELVLAGMWGGVRGALSAVMDDAGRFLARRDHVPNRTADQEFLRERLWPTIRTSVLVHDSVFDHAPRQDFPPHARLPPGCHVGGQAEDLLRHTGRRPDTVAGPAG